MPKLNVQQNNQNVIQAFKNALAIGRLKGIIASDGSHNFSTAGSNPNLLDNPWFTVNQIGATSGTHTTMPADRWKATYGSGSVNWTRKSDGCITFAPTNAASHGDIYQRIPDEIYDALAGTEKTVTVSVMMQDGTIYSGTSYLPTESTRAYIDVRNVGGTSSRLVVYVQASTKQLFVQAYYGSLTVKAVKLEKGSVSTLANDAPPKYKSEFDEVAYYFRRIKNTLGGTKTIATGYVNASTQAYFVLPYTMRTLTASNAPFTAVAVYNGSSYISATSIILDQTSDTIALIVNVASGLTAGQTCRLVLQTGGYIDLPADL